MNSDRVRLLFDVHVDVHVLVLVLVASGGVDSCCRPVWNSLLTMRRVEQLHY